SPLHLAIGESMGPPPGIDEDPEADLVGVAEAHQGGMDPTEMDRSVIGDGQQQADQQGAHPELAGTAPGGHHRLDHRGHSRGVDHGLEAVQADRLAHLAPRMTMAWSWSTGVMAAARSPRR